MIDQNIIAQRLENEYSLVEKYVKNKFIAFILKKCSFYPTSIFEKGWIVNSNLTKQEVDRKWQDYFNNIFVFDYGRKINLITNRINNERSIGLIHKNIIDPFFYSQPEDLLKDNWHQYIYVFKYQDYLQQSQQILLLANQEKVFSWLKTNQQWTRIPTISLGLNILEGIYYYENQELTKFNIQKIESELLIKNLEIEIGI